MPERNYPPAYLRYLKPRFSNFLRPSFWGTGIFLVLVGLVIWQSWFNPEFLAQSENKETAQEVVTPKTTEETTEETTISDEDKAIAADLDNIPSLLGDFAQATISVPIRTLQTNTQANNSETFLEDIINKRNTAINQAKSNPELGIVNQLPGVNAKNPFVVQAKNILQPNMGNKGNQLGINNINTLATSSETTNPQTAANLGIGLNNQNHQNTVVISPLEVAIQKSSSTTQINSLGSNGGVRPISAPHSLPSNSGIGYIQPTVTNVQPTYYSNFHGIQTTPNVGIPTNRVYGVPNNPYSVQPPIQGVVNSNTPIEYRNYGNYTVQQPGQLPQSNLSNPGQVQQGNNGFGR
ncbi:MAG: hypothetical protein RLZZ507_2109 [Cyanobacteriota bacterium]|jgi:hypothetical protein